MGFSGDLGAVWGGVMVGYRLGELNLVMGSLDCWDLRLGFVAVPPLPRLEYLIKASLPHQNYVHTPLKVHFILSDIDITLRLSYINVNLTFCPYPSHCPRHFHHMLHMPLMG